MNSISTLSTSGTSTIGGTGGSTTGSTISACIGGYPYTTYNPLVITDHSVNYNSIQIELLENGYLIKKGCLKYCATSHEEIGKIILILKETI